LDDGLELGQGRLEIGYRLFLSSHRAFAGAGWGTQFTSRAEKEC
jgi:hypothetical protein